MNAVINKFLLAGDKFISEMHLKKQDLLITLVNHLLKTKKEYKNLKKQEIQYIFTEMKWIKVVFSMTWLMEIL